MRVPTGFKGSNAHTCTANLLPRSSAQPRAIPSRSHRRPRSERMDQVSPGAWRLPPTALHRWQPAPYPRAGAGYTSDRQCETDAGTRDFQGAASGCGSVVKRRCIMQASRVGRRSRGDIEPRVPDLVRASAVRDRASGLTRHVVKKAGSEAAKVRVSAGGLNGSNWPDNTSAGTSTRTSGAGAVLHEERVKGVLLT